MRVDPALPIERHWFGSVVERLSTHARTQPDAICLAGPGVQWTYAETERCSTVLAQRLLKHGVTRGEIVGVVASRTPELALALLGIIKAGCGFFVMDATSPAHRVTECARFAKPRFLLVPKADSVEARQFMELLRPINIAATIPVPAHPHDFDGDSSVVSGSQTLDVNPDDLLYVAFTSGTTGFPRAVFGSHLPVSHFVDWQVRQFSITSQDRVSVLSGLAHDPLLRDLLMPIWGGASAWFPPSDVFDFPGRLFSWLCNSEISVAHLTPSLGQFILNIPGNRANSRCASLRAAFFGGEPLQWSFVKRFQGIAPKAAIINCYGATETPQVVGFHVLAATDHVSEKQANGLVPIGQGIEGCQLLVLNELDQLCGDGVEGEICVRTPYLPLKVEDIEGQRSSGIRPNPLGKMEDDLIYRTGDYGVYLEDGSVMCLGRRDRQLKIRGFRIDLSEIEKAVGQISEIQQYHLLPIQGSNGVHLRLYTVKAAETPITSDEVKRVLNQKLPAYMVPDDVMFIDAFPLTANRKIDSQALLRLSSPPCKPIDPSQTNSSKSRFRILAAVNQVLNVTERDVDYLLSSLDSLQRVQLACSLSESFGYEVGMQGLAKCRSLEDIESLLGDLQSNSGKQSTAPALDATRISNGGSSSRTTSGPTPSYRIPKKGRLVPRGERVLIGLKNRVFQLFARVAPDVWRIRLHKWRGVQIGQHVSIGYDSIVETSYPYLVSIGDFVNIGMRVTIIGHFRGMTTGGRGHPTVRIGDYAFIGPGVIILPNVEVGEGAVVAAGSVVASSVPPMTLVQGNPAKIVAKCGIPLSGRATYEEFLQGLKPIQHQGNGAPASHVLVP